MNGLRPSLSSLASAALKGKARQVFDLPLTQAVAHGSRSLVTSSSTSTTATTQAASSAASTSSSAAHTSSQDPLSLLKSQPNHYAVASITGRTFLVARGDLLTVPRLKDVHVGDVLVLDKVHEIGSRDYTLRAQDTLNTRRISTAVDLAEPHPILRASSSSSTSSSTSVASSSALSPQARRLFTRFVANSGDQRGPLLPLADTWSSRLLPNGLAHIGSSLPESTVKVTAIVTEHTKGALEKIVKKKRRKGYKKTIEHKQPYTRLRIEEIQIQPKM